MLNATKQLTLFGTDQSEQSKRSDSTFIDNMRLPVHRWFRYSAGFSARWAQQLIAERVSRDQCIRVFDPFAGSGTTLLAAQDAGVESYGAESHPFISRLARAKLARSTDPTAYRDFACTVLTLAKERIGSVEEYPPLIRKCYRDETLADLDRLRLALEDQQDKSPASELTWLTLVGILRRTSHVGTANWQYVLPRKTKSKTEEPFAAFSQQTDTIFRDMRRTTSGQLPRAELIEGDARTCEGVPSGSANLVITSPPYPNNYDYADATRLEMSFMREIDGWGDLQQAVRRHLVRSCTQHVPNSAADLEETLAADHLAPIRKEITPICEELAITRLSKGGKKTYHLMVACYFSDLAQVWHALRRVCESPCELCFVIGDSAPYGVYVPVIEWLGALALAAGFKEWRFEKTRDRNVKWKNRKHRVPLCEGRLWVTG